MSKIKAAIIGGAGYTGGELVRILLGHESVELAAIQSRSQAGHLLSQTHTDLLGQTSLQFVDKVSDFANIQVIFLALPHGEAKAFLTENKIQDSTLVIDLSQDFRLANQSTQGNRRFVYGLPELNREKIKTARSIANPGCFATAIQLALLPLAHGKKIKTASATGITGSTGAGQKLSETTHFSFRANNIQAYKSLTHQHGAEISESLGMNVPFIPWRGDFTRGIFVSTLVETTAPISKSEVLALYRGFYETHPFISVTDEAIDLKSVINTNRVHLEITQEGPILAIHSAIDNLIKGASGQAIQNMNLMLGLPEDRGLRLKGVAF